MHPPNLIPTAPTPYIAHPYSLLQTREVVGRREELHRLTDWVTANNIVPRDVRLFNVVAIGGMGKSALTWKWFNDIAPNELPHLSGRMWWSFYESDAYFENFVIRALAYAAGLPEAEVRQMPAPEREDRLWHVLDQRPFLLVLDGLERILLAYARMDARTCRMMTWTSRPPTTSPGSTAYRTTSRRPIWKNTAYASAPTRAPGLPAAAGAGARLARAHLYPALPGGTPDEHGPAPAWLLSPLPHRAERRRRAGAVARLHWRRAEWHERATAAALPCLWQLPAVAARPGR